jgi:hypothetical protein
MVHVHSLLLQQQLMSMQVHASSLNHVKMPIKIKIHVVQNQRVVNGHQPHKEQLLLQVV